MTYISRKTRIIVSRWTDECDSDYILRAVRKRSDGRFKRHSSCDDLRAWVNDYYIKHEHLVDLMSDGEFSDRPPFRLFGRFIPVPILIKLIQNLKIADPEDNLQNEEKKKIDDLCKSFHDKYTCIESSDFLSKNHSRDLRKTASTFRIQWEKGCLEKSLYESTSLLCRALATLERVDNIVDLTIQENENAKNEEIHLAFSETRLVCHCNTGRKEEESRLSSDPRSSGMYVKKIQDSSKCTELLRKISGLREKLKTVQECRETITREIRKSENKRTESDSPKQVTELYSFQEQCNIKKLKKKLEKLIMERGRLLSEMCDALNCLNALKRSSRLSLARRKSSRMSRSEDSRGRLGECNSCLCGCTCARVTSDSEKINYDSSSGGIQCDFPNDSFIVQTPSEGSTYNPRSKSSDMICGFDDNDTRSSFYNETKRKASRSVQNLIKPCPTQTFEFQSKTSKQKQQQSKSSKTTAKPSCLGKTHKETRRQSRISFADENESPCRKKFYQDDLAAFEKSVPSQQKAVIEKVVKKIEVSRSQLLAPQSDRRPRSSPTTKKEKKSISFENCHNGGYHRRVRSETNMQEIEKTLRNYEQRLKCYDALECKIEEIRQNLLEANRIKREYGKQKQEGQKMMETERENSCREMLRLSSENKILKRQMEHLKAKFLWQCKKIQNLKATAQKNWELECETEELKKEMANYQNTLEQQRKCIKKWESVVALQRKEIENLVNHIRQLTTAHNSTVECLPASEKRDIQRSRSYSPHVMRPQIMLDRVKTHGKICESSSEEDITSCFRNEFGPLGRRSQQKKLDDDCYPSLSGRRMNW